jgi:uncharacterized protein (TIGR02246 family)
MKKGLIVLCLLFGFCVLHAQSSAKTEILKQLNAQVDSWNNNDLEGFMTAYWNDDSLMFTGKNGIRYGYNNILNNYRKAFPDKEAMGKLSYNILNIKGLSPSYYFVAGKFMVKRSAGDLEGYFTLLFKKINGKWLIISDHSS